MDYADDAPVVGPDTVLPWGPDPDFDPVLSRAAEAGDGK